MLVVAVGGLLLACGSRKAPNAVEAQPCPTAPADWRGPISSDGCPVSGMYDPDTSCAIVYTRTPDAKLAPTIQPCR